MRMILAILAGCCMQGFACFGQIDAESAQKHVIIKFSPLALVDFDNSVQFGVEVPLGKSGLSLQQDLGYGPTGMNMWYEPGDDRPNKETFKSRTQLRYYYLTRRRMKPYVAGELLLKKVIYSDNKWVGMECEQPWGDCNYFENKLVKTRRMVHAGHAKAGMQFYFSSRIAMDLFAGVGFRNIRVRSISDLPANTRIPRTDRWFEYDTPGTNEFIPSLAMGVHFGIILGKFED
ncbi:hypothetical protein MUK70_01445 [Dyadobacter chenwenxiniae]|uniref:DUF3575 domain-containing protein n=1 Tax=Dyadobacter chenwenxiniae TaxID=2906456 RepID=A0A9X1PPT0_9BACT|nr:hypothetical protein [Dyadobacter chenwenxiniae]MCF0062586.1 hypothetical protein [Dyadobacter chenwenxiniae]UON83667.1 hypothetical protein MUK70_01445 [Dyadobacter chenwenxiniae]